MPRRVKPRVMSLRLPKDLMIDIHILAEEEGIYVSQWIRRALTKSAAEEFAKQEAANAKK